jgi:hypothetical protein
VHPSPSFIIVIINSAYVPMATRFVGMCKAGESRRAYERSIIRCTRTYVTWASLSSRFVVLATVWLAGWSHSYQQCVGSCVRSVTQGPFQWRGLRHPRRDDGMLRRAPWLQSNTTQTRPNERALSVMSYLMQCPRQGALCPQPTSPRSLSLPLFALVTGTWWLWSYSECPNSGTDISLFRVSAGCASWPITPGFG